VFGKNEIVGKKYFKEAGDKYLITSIFFTLQGEGPLAGYPAVFVRLAKCNLACSFCDTYFDSGDWMDVLEIRDRIDKVIDDHFLGWIPDWVIQGKLALILTGGEPSLQNLMPLLEFFEDRFVVSQIETNGILHTELPESTILVCSPKCVEKKGVASHYIKPCDEVLERANCLKFVISAEKDSPYRTVPQWALDWQTSSGGDVFVSPMNIYNEEPQAAKTARNSNSTSLEQRSTVEEVISFWTPGLLNLKENQANHEWAADYALTHGLRLNLQMHLYVGKA